MKQWIAALLILTTVVALCGCSLNINLNLNNDADGSSASTGTTGPSGSTAPTNPAVNGKSYTVDAEKVMSDDALVLSEDMEAISAGEEVTTTASDYFAAVRLSRQEARDSAVNLLQEAMAYTETDAGTKDLESAVELETIVQTALSEAQIESLVIAKGYADCVAYMSDTGISVAVASPEGGMQNTDVAVIADIVLTQTDLSLDQIHVVEVT